MQGFFDTLESEWQDAVSRWVAAVNEFQAEKARLEANGNAAAALGERDSWLDQLDRANKIQTSIEMLQEGLAQTSNWFRSTFGLAGLRRMGAIPLIPIAIITGSIAAITAWTYSTRSMNAELERRWAYIQANPNATPQQVTALLNSGERFVPDFAGAVQNVGSLAVWIVAGGLLLYFGPLLLKRWSK